MDGEVLRDAALATAGLLVERVGGEPAKPYAPAGLWEEVAMPESNTKTYVPDAGEGLYRRSVYTFWKRASPPPDLETFDGPSREVVCTRRPRSNTPLQAFVTMNDRQWVEAARHLAERTLRAAADTPGRIDLLARKTLARPLTPAEKAHVVASHRRFVELYQGDPERAAKLIRVGPTPAAADVEPIELAVWTLVASQFLNLDEFLTK
jgi:hypothetical protein